MSVDLSEDKNIQKMYAQSEADQIKSQRRYMGMSSMGEPCDRKLWNDFRHTTAPEFKAETLYNFADGHYSEEITAKRLNAVKGITLITHQENGEQIGHSDIYGHLRGHMDGKIKGLYEAPRKWHVWEHKCSAVRKFNEFKKLKESNDDTDVLEKWNTNYYIQAIMYMHYEGTDRHYLTVASAGSRTYKTVRTHGDKKVAKRTIERAKDIIFSDKPSDKIATDASSYMCRFCNHKGLCHGVETPSANCRTCIYSFPTESGDGAWYCQRFSSYIDDEDIHKQCDKHLFIPKLLENFAEFVRADPVANSITYVNKLHGAEFVNGETMDEYTSEEIANSAAGILGDDTVNDIKQTFGARVNA